VRQHLNWRERERAFSLVALGLNGRKGIWKDGKKKRTFCRKENSIPKIGVKDMGGREWMQVREEKGRGFVGPIRLMPRGRCLGERPIDPKVGGWVLPDREGALPSNRRKKRMVMHN